MKRAALVLLLAAGGCQTGQHQSSERNPAVLEDGYYVRMYYDGSASVSNSPDTSVEHWSIDCRIDKMRDKRRCSFDRATGGVLVYYGFSATPQSICISGHDFPGRRGQIRVDKHQPITTDRDGCVPAGRILSQLKTGSQLLTRRYRWPYDYPVDTSTYLEGFNKAMTIVDRIRSGGQKWD
ncbi:hypothetical protein [Stappia sp. TSB10P1A]|uniref:hypothetical protein n=1 Tax=Stappia sp. TSB10P1A TaxID=2003585 RepID=UPI001643DABF|nr:hypothetical protein [Stappia sp. TSB10P1A]